MSKETTKKLHKIALAKERRARIRKLNASGKVRRAGEAVEQLDASHAEAAAALVGAADVESAASLDGAALQLLEMGRGVYTDQRSTAKDQLDAEQERLQVRTGEHLVTVVQAGGRERLYDHHRKLRRAEAEKKRQRELDDLTAGRRGRGD